MAAEMDEKRAILDAFESIDKVLAKHEQTTHGRMGEVSFGDMILDTVKFWHNPNAYTRSNLAQVIKGFLEAARDPRPNDPTDTPYANSKLNSKVRIYLDGIICSYCVEANADEEWVKVIHRDRGGNIVYVDQAQGIPMTDTLHGKVTIRRNEG